MEEYKTVLGFAKAEYTVERSRFIANVCHVESEEQATVFIKQMKSDYWDAKHNVYAYSLKESNLKRFSDDGEPQGTAGKPILDVISGNKLVDVVIVVTRYFGGILLGTGGLVRAYSKTAKDGILAANTVLMKPCLVYEATCAYSYYNTFEYLLNNFSVDIKESVFETDVKVRFAITGEKEDGFIKACGEKLKNNIHLNLLGEDYAPFKINL